ncbi:ATP-binding cassette domain-containing protein [Glycomyces xiaoerkulensis]|uniref:ATP-binding cassette domain-containing protein n=1 Tax=Glycomyces xiaoerkulensis TaxID=2038139 RepID=UPI000C25A3CE|nr:ABC transporter ATP-binding protein [Glycomyces xiaoerkulensis]
MPRHHAAAVLLRELTARKSHLVWLLLWSLLESVPALLSGLLLARAIDQFLADRILAGFASLTGLLAAAGVAAIAVRRLFPHIAALVEPVRDALLEAVATSLVTAPDLTAGKLDSSGINRMTEQIQTVRNILFATLRTMRQVVFTVVAALIGLALLTPLLAGPVAALAVATLGLFALLLPALARRSRTVLLAKEDVATHGGLVFTGKRDIMACNGRSQAVADMAGHIDAELAATRALARASASRKLLVFLGGQLPLLGLLGAAPWLIREGRLSVGEVVGAAAYLSVTLEPALRNLITMAGGWGLELMVTLDRLGESLRPARPPEIGDRLRGDRDADRPASSGDRLELRGVTFRYGSRAAPVVEELSLAVDEGEHLAVVGASGIGKSTLADLLAGLRRPDEGSILLGGVPLPRIGEPLLRRRICLIPQEAYVFAGSIRENLTYLAPHADDAECLEAARATGLAGVLHRLGGLDAPIGTGGADLSLGERQLVALTRSRLSPARVLILDEATSHLDPAAEVRAEAAVAARPGTLIVIAHRISSAARADRILLLDTDHVAIGGHDRLLETDRRYAALVDHWRAADSEPSAGEAVPTGGRAWTGPA